MILIKRILIKKKVCIIRNPIIIGGPNINVEIDEACSLDVKTTSVATAVGIWGYLSRSLGMLYVHCAQSLEIIFIAGSTVNSDLWPAYGGIAAMGFNHLTVDHSLDFVDPNTGNSHGNQLNKETRGTMEHVEPCLTHTFASGCGEINMGITIF